MFGCGDVFVCLCTCVHVLLSVVLMCTSVNSLYMSVCDSGAGLWCEKRSSVKVRLTLLIPRREQTIGNG